AHPAGIARRPRAAFRGQSEPALVAAVTQGREAMDENLDAIDRVTTHALDLSFKYGPKVAVALAILVLGWIAARWTGRITERWLSRYKLDRPVVQLLVRAAKIGVLALFGIVALQNLGVELLPLIAG